LDEKMRFLSKEGSYKVSQSILDVGVITALDMTIWRKDEFVRRGGIYDWKKDKVDMEW
jgi:radical S-adenosyl methionine domain-containing protein 2